MKLIDFLLRLYPGEFRARYGRQMRDFHDARVREDGDAWPRIVGDHLTSATAEQLQAARPDVKYALRGMVRRPGFAVVVILTIALGVGANAAIFSVVNGILLRPLPYRDVDRLIVLGHEPPYWLVSEPQYATYRDKVRSFESLAGYTNSEGNLSTNEDPERIGIAAVGLNFFSTLGVRPMLGRTFAPGDDRVRPFPVVVLSHDIWQRRFNSDSGIVGKSVSLNGTSRTVIGVMPPRFEFPSKDTELWLPHCSQRLCTSLPTLLPDTADGWANHYLFVVGRLRPGYGIEQARSETNALARQIMRDQRDTFDPRTPLLPKMTDLRHRIVGSSRPYLLALLGAVGVVLLVVCANVANLLLARGESRRREMSLRMALGASRRRLVTQLLTEAIVLSSVGGALGLALSWAGSRALVALAPASLPRLDEIRIDWLVVAFCVAVSLVAGIVFGIIPALRASREDPAEALKSVGKGAGAAGGSTRARRVLAVSEVALAMVVLSGAGMLVRSLVHLQSYDMGFEPTGALTLKVSLNQNTYRDTQTIAFYQQLLESVRAIPGVRAGGAARWLPVVDQGGLWDIRIDGKDYPPGQGKSAVPQEVTPGYFAAMGLTIQSGRDFSDADRDGAPLVAVISERFAKDIWQGENALGRRFSLGRRDRPWVTIVGIVEDFRSRNFTDKPEPTMYFPHAQLMQSGYYVPRSMSLVLRTRVENPMVLANPARAAVRALEPSAPVSSVMTLDAVVSTSTAQRRFTTTLIAGFALLALVLAGIGIYGVISYAVSERTFEIGVRVALGASRGQVLGLVVGDGAKLALIGITAGIIGSAILARVIRSLLVDVPMVDVITLGGVAVLLTIVALGASALPARRATAVNPTEALRAG
jgi:putative ABC transport system permease protein